MATPATGKRVRTITDEQIAPTQGDAFAGKMRAALSEVGNLTLSGYVSIFWSQVDEPDAKLDIYKMVGGRQSKKGQLAQSEIAAEEIEGWIINAWGPGKYQLRPQFKGRYYSPPSVVAGLGESEADVDAPTGVDVDTIIAQAAQRVGNAVALQKLVEVGRKPEDTMKMDPTLLAALKPDMGPITAMMEASNRRAEAAELRNHELTLKLMDQRGSVTQGAMPLLGELFKYLKPEHLNVLLNPTAPESNWLDTLRELAKDFAPAIQLLVTKVMESSGLPTPTYPVRALPAAAVPDSLTPTAASPVAPGGSAMPLQLAPEGEYAKGLLLDYIKTGDFHNALATLESFPAFVPGEAGMVPLGPALISTIDPSVHAKVYVGQLLMIMPEIGDMKPQAEAFIAYIQKVLMQNDEAARRAQPGTVPRPPWTVPPSPQNPGPKADEQRPTSAD